MNSQFYADHQPPTTEEAAVSMALRKQYVFYQGSKNKAVEKEKIPLVNIDLEEMDDSTNFPYREEIREYSDYEVLSHFLLQ